MARGSPTITFRLDDALMDDMDVAIDSRNERTRETPWTRTDFIRAAIREKLDKMRRSRECRKNKKGNVTCLATK